MINIKKKDFEKAQYGDMKKNVEILHPGNFPTIRTKELFHLSLREMLRIERY